MWCTKCGEPVSRCQCPDIDTRLESFKGNTYVVLAYCPVCGHHIDRCTCVPADVVKQ